MTIHSHSFYTACSRWQGAVKHLRISAIKAAFLTAGGIEKAFISAFLAESFAGFPALRPHDAETLPEFLRRNPHDAESLLEFR